MLLELSIKNFAIIDDIRIRFAGKLTILSGETGAGKSIVINAFNLLLGGRAAADLIRAGAEAAEIEAAFTVSAQSQTAAILAEQGLGDSPELIVRRIISRNDRHKTYINGRLAPVQQLNAVMSGLASISGQHAHQTLLREEEHLAILDLFGELTTLRAEVQSRVNTILPLIRRLDDLLTRSRRQTDHLDLLAFQKKEIDDAAIAPGEDNVLEDERKRLKNAELLHRTAREGMDVLYHGDGSISERLADLRKGLEKAAAIDPALQPVLEQVSALMYQTEDAAAGLKGYCERMDLDGNRLEEVETRLDFLQKLKRKYGGSLDAVLEFRNSIQTQLSEYENIDGAIREIRQALDDHHRVLDEAARKLSAGRSEAAARLATKVEAELAELKMEGARFEVRLDPIPAEDSTSPYLRSGEFQIAESGVDRAAFLLAPNVGEPLKPLARIASGGELSRIVLAVKAILAHTGSLETVVFDEVDAGIGGAVAEVVGEKLVALSRVHQIICITHLPQIAKFGDHHYRISKHVQDGRTQTRITELSSDERIDEIARMLGGTKITRATLDHARELLKKTA